MKHLSKTIICFSTLLMLSTVLPSLSDAYMKPKAPSCHDDVANIMKQAGESPFCTPPILTNEAAIDFLKQFNAKKIKGKWYIFLPAKDFNEEFDIPSRWKTISILVSSVESVFREKAECYIAKLPETDAEKEALLAGNYPKELIAASANHVPDAKEMEEKDWPEYHHRLFYKLHVF